MTVSVELTAIICMSVAGIFWLAGLSFATNRNKEDIQALALKQKEDILETYRKHDGLEEKLSGIWKELAGIGKSIARMETRHESHSDEN